MEFTKINFNMATTNGIQQHEGYLFNNEETGIKSVAHTIYNGLGWSVSDFRTGILIGSYATNRKDAVLYCNVKVRNVLDIVEEKLSKYPTLNN